MVLMEIAALILDFMLQGFPFGTWNDSSNFPENLGGMRRDQDHDGKLFSVDQVLIWCMWFEFPQIFVAYLIHSE